jgi:protein CpxP
MKPWIKRTLYGLFGASIAVGGLAACGHRYEGHHGGHMGGEHSEKFRGKMIERVASRLDLNEDQKKRLAALTVKLDEQRLALIGKSANPRAEFQALIAGEKFDKLKAQALIAEKTAALNSKSPEVLAAAADFFDSLTPAQQQKVREYLQPRRGWWHYG